VKLSKHNLIFFACISEVSEKGFGGVKKKLPPAWWSGKNVKVL